jgi:hypothetical protein
MDIENPNRIQQLTTQTREYFWILKVQEYYQGEELQFIKGAFPWL